MNRRPFSARRRACTAVLAVVLAVGTAACSSDTKSSSTTTVTASASTGAGNTLDTTSGATPATGGGDLDSQRAIVADRVISEAAKVGYVLKPDCVAALVGKLSDADIALLAASAADTTPGATTPPLSAEGDALGNSILGCSKGSTDQALIDQAAAVVLSQESNQSLDKACITKQLATLSDDQLKLIIESKPDSTDPRLSAAVFALFDCIGLTNGSTATT